MIGSAVERVTCSRCAATLDAEDRYCPLCGNSTGTFETRGEDGPHARCLDVGSTFRCSACGATVSWSARHGALRCAFCGSEYVQELPTPTRREEPTHVLHFRIDRDAARGRFRQWRDKGWFRPWGFSRDAKVENLVPVLLPCWRYACEVETCWTADVARTGLRLSGAPWMPASGHRHVVHDDILVAASGGLTKAELDAITPFPAEGLADVDEASVQRFPKDYQVEAPALQRADARTQALEELDRRERAGCREDLPNSSHRRLRTESLLRRANGQFVLLPVWISSYRHRQRTYRLLINGATGKLLTTAPTSWSKIALLVLGVVGTVALLQWFMS